MKDILSGAQGSMNQEELLKYLREELDAAEKHQLEQHAVDNVFESDAMDGLMELQNKEKIQLIVEGLNRDLKRKTTKKQLSRAKRNIKPQWGLYFSILILLIILVLVYLYIHRLRQP